MLARILFVSLMLSGTSARANDSMAELGTGGLILSRSDVIAMDSENLFISKDKVTVDYVFTNRSDADVETIVAFPMPDIVANPYGVVSIPNMESDNFLGFSVAIDGKAVTPQLEQRAVAAGIDVTDLLKAAGVPLYPFGAAAAKALEKLPAAVAADWVARGILIVEEFDDGGGMRKVNSPYWLLRSTYWWKATFPAGRAVKVAHRYTPSLGGSAGVTFMSGGRLAGEGYLDYKHKYCMDDAFERAVLKAARDNPDGYPPLTESRLSYVLTSGGNWALGTIGEFHLTIDKGAPENLVSFCGDGVEKIGPTTFRVSAENYFPDRDIDILILQPADYGEDSFTPSAGSAPNGGTK